MKKIEKILIIRKYENDLNKITLNNYELKEMNINNFQFIEKFLIDILIINDKNINYEFNYNSLIINYIIKKYNIDLYKTNYENRKYLLIKYLKKDLINMLDKIKTNNYYYKYYDLLYLLVIEYIKEINYYNNEININEKNLKSIKRKMKNIFNDNYFI